MDKIELGDEVLKSTRYLLYKFIYEKFFSRKLFFKEKNLINVKEFAQLMEPFIYLLKASYGYRSTRSANIEKRYTLIQHYGL